MLHAFGGPVNLLGLVLGLASLAFSLIVLVLAVLLP